MAPAAAVSNVTFRAPPPPPPKGTTVVAGVPASRISVEHPAPGRRIVTLFGTQPNGSEVMVLRITYTRRSD
jgi:hypothetical protein